MEDERIYGEGEPETTQDGGTQTNTDETQTEEVVEISTINHEMNQYDIIEGIEFTPLMPEFIDKYGIETVGGSDISVKNFGRDAKGNDEMEVIDIDAIYEDGTETNSDSENG